MPLLLFWLEPQTCSCDLLLSRTNSGPRVGKKKRHGVAFFCGRNRQIKEEQEQSVIATHSDYDLVEDKASSNLVTPTKIKGEGLPSPLIFN